MAAQYAKQQPAGYDNYVKKVAVVGATGQVGKYVVEELLKTGKHQVTAITRADSSSKIPSGVERRPVNYEDHSSLVEGLQGQEVLIITMAAMAPPDTQDKLIRAAAEAGVPWVIPNEWGFGASTPEAAKESLIGEPKQKSRDLIESLGKSSWIGTSCGFWYEYSLSASPFCYGFDFKNKEVTFYNDGDVTINTSTWPMCGKAVAALLSSKVLPEDENDKDLCISNFRNNWFCFASYTITQKDMFESALRVTGTTEKDWKISHEDVKKRYGDGVALLKTGSRAGFGKALYARFFYPDGSGNPGERFGLQNEKLDLPKEDLDTSTKLAIKMVEENGYMF